MPVTEIDGTTMPIRSAPSAAYSSRSSLETEGKADQASANVKQAPFGDPTRGAAVAVAATTGRHRSKPIGRTRPMPAIAVTIAPDGWLTDVDLGDPDLRPAHLRSLIGCAAVHRFGWPRTC